MASERTRLHITEGERVILVALVVVQVDSQRQIIWSCLPGRREPRSPGTSIDLETAQSYCLTPFANEPESPNMIVGTLSTTTGFNQLSRATAVFMTRRPLKILD